LASGGGLHSPILKERQCGNIGKQIESTLNCGNNWFDQQQQQQQQQKNTRAFFAFPSTVRVIEFFRCSRGTWVVKTHFSDTPSSSGTENAPETLSNPITFHTVLHHFSN